MNNIHKQTDLIIFWAQELAEKYSLNVTTIMVEFYNVNKLLNDTEQSKEEVENKVKRGEMR